MGVIHADLSGLSRTFHLRCVRVLDLTFQTSRSGSCSGRGAANSFVLGSERWCSVVVDSHVDMRAYNLFCGEMATFTRQGQNPFGVSHIMFLSMFRFIFFDSDCYLPPCPPARFGFGAPERVSGEALFSDP